MNTLITNPRQFRLYGAVLAMAALLAVLLAVTMTAGPTMAQATAPDPCSEESKPDADTVGIIRDGYYAVFDAYWDGEEGHLSNNFCPPEVTVTETTSRGVTTTTYTRSDANTHISETVFAIPDSYKVTVVDTRPGVSNGNPGTVTGDTIDIADFPFMAKNGAVSAGDSLWWVRLDQPWTTGADKNEASDLQIGFSTDLLEEADWFKDENKDGDSDGPPLLFRFDAVHVLQDGTPEEAHVLGAHLFAFDQRTTDTALEDPQWSNVETATESEIEMEPGKYRQMQFAFTKPGMYLVQVNFEGYVRQKKPTDASDDWNDWKPVSPDVSLTSPVQWYKFHVGPEADLSTEIEAGAVSTTGGVSTVPVTVTATNGGPNGAENVEVEINLPPGLSAPATLPAGASSSGCGVIAWQIEVLTSGASPTLEFNATVDSGATGARTATAEIRSTAFDSDTTNNAASAEVTLGGTNVRPPFFPGVSRSIAEHAVAGAHAGEPVAAESPDGRALTYTLSGPCSNKFEVHSNGQIVLASGHTLDYEKQWEYPLTLHVSDGVNASGAADTSADDSTPVLVEVIDTKDSAVHPAVTFSLINTSGSTVIPGESPQRLSADVAVSIVPRFTNPPQGTVRFRWDTIINGVYGEPKYISGDSTVGAIRKAAPQNDDVANVPEIPVAYKLHATWEGGGITDSYTIIWEYSNP